MKKFLLTLCLSLAALNTFAGDSLMIGNPLLLLYDGPVSNTEPRPGYGRAPICAPSVSISIKRHAEINLNGGFSVEKGATLVIQ